jgi:neutral ceramidase
LFKAGTTDGPGEFDFTQGNTTNPIWNLIASVLHKATPEEKACQHPKPILLSTGDYTFPEPWAPDILPIQVHSSSSECTSSSTVAVNVLVAVQQQ